MLGIATAAGKIDWQGENVSDQDIGRLLPDKKARVVLTNSVDTPYRCLGGFIYSLQRLGYRHVGFISEPPAKR